MPTTSRGFRYPAASDTPDVPRDMGYLAADVDAQYISGTAGTRPAFGVVGRIHYATDTGEESLDIGTAWVRIGGSNTLRTSDIGVSVQGYDADLAAIAALSTQATGRDLLTAADAAAIRTKAGLGAAALLATPIPVASGGTGSATAAAARLALGVVPGEGEFLASGGTNQGINNMTTLLNFTELFDNGGYYDGTNWTPPAGQYLMFSNLTPSAWGANAGRRLETYLFRDGASLGMIGTSQAAGTDIPSVNALAAINANGSQSFTIRSFNNNGSINLSWANTAFGAVRIN